MDTKTPICSSLPLRISNTFTPRMPRLVVAHSHFNTPLSTEGDRGMSRLWADASPQVKLKALEQVLLEAKNRNFSKEEAAFALSVAYVESGFNPDAAATTTSASGLGQFINKTGAAYGLHDGNRFNIKENASAMLSEIKRLFTYTEKKHTVTNSSDLYALSYSHYHDGNILTDNTIKNSKEKIPPLVAEFTNFIETQCTY